MFETAFLAKETRTKPRRRMSRQENKGAAVKKYSEMATFPSPSGNQDFLW